MSYRASIKFFNVKDGQIVDWQDSGTDDAYVNIARGSFKIGSNTIPLKSNSYSSSSDGGWTMSSSVTLNLGSEKYVYYEAMSNKVILKFSDCWLKAWPYSYDP